MNGPFYPGAGVFCVNPITHGALTIQPGEEGICCGPESEGPVVYWSALNVTTVCHSQDVRLKLQKEREATRYAFIVPRPVPVSEYAGRAYEDFATQPGIKASPLPNDHAVTRGLAERGQLKFKAKGTIYRKEGKSGVDVLLTQDYESAEACEAIGGVLHALDNFKFNSGAQHIQTLLADGAYLHVECERVN